LQIRQANGYDCITCCGIETIIAEVRRGVKDDAKVIDQALRELCTELTVKAEAGVKVSVGPIIYWRSFDDTVRRSCNDLWRSLETEFRQIEFLPRISNLRLSDDGVHLQDKSAVKYIEHVVGESLAVWLREDVDSEMDDGQNDSQDLDTTMVNVHSTPGFSQTKSSRPAGEVVSGVAQVRNELRSFKRTMEDRLLRDLFAFARHEESIDTAKNEKMLDRSVFSGVQIDKLEGTAEEKIPVLKEAITKIVTAVLDLGENDDKPTIAFVKHLNPQVRSSYRVIEARFETKEIAGKIRTEFGKKAKAAKAGGAMADSLKGVSISMSVTRETKVRIEVMRALAKILTSNSTQEVSAFVLQYMPRPMMKVVIKKSERDIYSRVYGYTEAIEHVKALYPIHDQDLVEAYSKAGNMKDLEHKFVILKNAAFGSQRDNDEDDRRGNKRKK